MGYYEGPREDSDDRNNLGNREGSFVDIEQVPADESLQPDQILMSMEDEKERRARRIEKQNVNSIIEGSGNFVAGGVEKENDGFEEVPSQWELDVKEGTYGTDEDEEGMVGVHTQDRIARSLIPELTKEEDYARANKDVNRSHQPKAHKRREDMGPIRDMKSGI